MYQNSISGNGWGVVEFPIQTDQSEQILIQTEIDQLNERYKTLEKLFKKEMETTVHRIKLEKV